MFHYWISLVLLFQLPTLSQALACKTCSQWLQFSLNETINATSCTNTVSGTMCQARLIIDHNTGDVRLTLGAVRNESLPDDVSKTFVMNSISIDLNRPMLSRGLQLNCASNDSCLQYITETYVKIKEKKYDQLLTNLRGKLKNNVTNNALSCHNHQDKPVPCSGGQCELNSGGDSNFHRRCSSSFGSFIEISTMTVDDESVESMFTYHCDRNLCNDDSTSREVRQLLKDAGLLKPRGVAMSGSTMNTMASTFASTLTLITMSIMASTLGLF